MATNLLARQNFTAQVESSLNRHVNMELYASYIYQSMDQYFNRDDVALPGFGKYFKRSYEEKKEHAEKLMKYVNKRGGRVVLQNVQKPVRDEWGRGLDALQTALAQEKEINQSLLNLHSVGIENRDANLTDFLETEYLQEQVDWIKQLADLSHKCQKVGPNLGEYLFDQELNDIKLP